MRPGFGFESLRFTQCGIKRYYKSKIQQAKRKGKLESFLYITSGA